MSNAVPDQFQFSQSTVEQIAALARSGAQPHQLEPSTEYLSVNADGSVERFHSDDEQLRVDRIHAVRQMESLASLVDYVNRHEDNSTEVFASKNTNAIVAVIDGAKGFVPAAEREAQRFGREKFKAVFRLQHSDSWKAWTSISGKLLDQVAFAEFVEDWAEDVIKPSAADVLEIAQSIEATNGVEFASSQRLDNGETQFKYTETVNARAGQKGQLTIPKELKLALQPFAGIDTIAGEVVRVPVTARFRYRIVDSGLKIGVKLVGLDRILDYFWQSIHEELDREILDAPIFRGQP